MNILSLLRRFIPPYKWQVAANLFFNVLSTILSLFSFATIIPVLQILFGLAEGTAAYLPLGAAATMSDALDILKNNLYYFLQTQIEIRGAQSVLLLLGVCLVLLTGCTIYFFVNFFVSQGTRTDAIRPPGITSMVMTPYKPPFLRTYFAK